MQMVSQYIANQLLELGGKGRLYANYADLPIQEFPILGYPAPDVTILPDDLAQQYGLPYLIIDCNHGSCRVTIEGLEPCEDGTIQQVYFETIVNWSAASTLIDRVHQYTPWSHGQYGASIGG